MNKIYKNLMALLLIIAGVASAQAYDLCFRLTGADKMIVEINWVEMPIDEGTNWFYDYDSSYLNIQIKAKGSENILKSAVNQSGQESQWKSDLWCAAGEYSGAGTKDTYTFSAEAVSIADAATGTFTLKIDNPERVSVSTSSLNYISQDLVAGANVMKYIPGAQTSLTLQATDPYNTAPLYSVEKDGVAVAKGSGSASPYTMDITAGMVVDVKADYPDVDVPLNFTFEGDGKDAISKMTVDGVEVDSYKTGTVNVKLGQRVYLYFNDLDYDITHFVWGTETDYTWSISQYSSFVFAPVDILVAATKFPAYAVNVNVDYADRVQFWKGYSGSGVLVPLQDGKNETSISSKNTRITIVPVDGFVISKVTVDGVEEEREANGTDYAIELPSADCTVDIETEVLVRDQAVAVYVEGRDDWRTLTLWGPNWVWNESLTEGYNVFNKAKTEIQPELHINGELAAGWEADYSGVAVYLNDNPLENRSSWDLSVTINDASNGDVIKVFTSGAPETYDVTIAASAEVEGLYNIVRDEVSNIDGVTDVTCFSGTSFKVTSASELVVKVNDTVIAKEEENAETRAAENVYKFTVNENTKVSIEPAEANGIYTISSENAETEIYNLQGIRVNSANIPAGVYIINGKKVVVK